MNRPMTSAEMTAWVKETWEKVQSIPDVAAAERESCALLVEQMGIEGYGTLAIAAAIRARGDK